MELRTIFYALTLSLFASAGYAQQTQSTISPNVPAVGFLVEQSGPQFRSNWQNAISDINTLFGRTRPASPTIQYAVNFPGGDLGQQLGACVAALPVFGGVCDGRGLPNSGTISSFTVAQSGVTIVLPCGFYLQTGSIIVQAASGVAGLIITGCGASQNATGTNLFWQGNSTSPAIDLRGVRDSELSNFTIGANSALPLAEGIRRETWPGAVSTRVTFRNIIIAGNVNNSLIKGIRWCTGFDCSNGQIIGNNDLDTIQNVLVANYTNCAFSIEGTQSKTHMFLNASMAGQSFSQRGVCTTQGADPSTSAGSFRWYGGSGGSNQIADFDLASVTDSIVISGCNFESSKRLLVTESAGSASWSVSIVGCRWTSNAINADGKAIIYKLRGPLYVSGFDIETGGSTVPPVFSIESSGTPELGTAVANVITTASAAVGYTPFVCSSTTISCWSSIGNMTTDNSGNDFIVPNTLQANPLLVSQLPACTAQRQGDTQFVTDQATAVAYHGAVTGSGGNKQNVRCDGTAWYQD